MRNMTDEELIACAREALRRGLISPLELIQLCPGDEVTAAIWIREDISDALMESDLPSSDEDIDNFLRATDIRQLKKDWMSPDWEEILHKRIADAAGRNKK